MSSDKSETEAYTEERRLLEVEQCEPALEAIHAGEYETAKEIFETLADEGNLTAKLDLARLHLRELINLPDLGLAVSLLHEASNLGMSDASDALGSVYEDGEGVAQNLAQALKFYRLAADQASTNGMFNLGRCYLFLILIEL